jgi:hypothetical protein
VRAATRLLVGAALVLGIALPAHAAPTALGGQCDGKVDVACQEHPCAPDQPPCEIEICLIWVGSKCGVL